MHCNKCGTQAPAGSNFCETCGSSLQAVMAQAGPSLGSVQQTTPSAFEQTPTSAPTQETPAPSLQQVASPTPVQQTSQASYQQATSSAPVQQTSPPNYQQAPSPALVQQTPQPNYHQAASPTPESYRPPPPYQPPASHSQYQPPSDAYMHSPSSYAGAQPHRDTRDQVMTVGGWMGMMLLSMIPLVNIILVLIWAFGGNVNRNKQNLCRASLLVGIIMAGILIVIAVIGGIAGALLSSM